MTSESLRKVDRMVTPLDDFVFFVQEALRLPVSLVLVQEDVSER